MPSPEEKQRLEQDKLDIKRFRLNSLQKEMKDFSNRQAENMKDIDPQVLKDAGLSDARAHSNAGIFDLFVMAKHGVDMKDIPKFERGELEGHDKAQYVKEFETFLKDHPISKKDEKGKVTYYPENAKAWGELYKAADKKLSEYRFPDVDLGNPENWQKVKDDVVLISKIGTDWLQVIQNNQMEKFEMPELNEAFQQGFGSEEAANHFWANIVTAQNLKIFMEAAGVRPMPGTASLYAARCAEGRWFLNQNQSLYGGKSLQEFRQNIPEVVAFNSLAALPLGSRSLDRMPEADRKALEDFLEKGTPLPKNLEDRMKVDFDLIKNSMYPEMVKGEVGGQFNARPRNVENLKGSISADGSGERIMEVAQMTDEQKRAAELGFQKLIFPAYNLYSISVNMADQGKNLYDLIEVNGKPLREHCEAKYDADPVFGEDRKWAELSEEERRRFMRMEATRAALDQGEQVACHEYVPNAEGKLVLDEKPATVGRFDPKAQREKEKRNRLPEFEELPDEVLKASYYNPRQMVDPIITSLPKEKVDEEVTRPPFSELDEREPDTAAGKLYLPEDEEDAVTITDYAQVGGIGKRHIYKVQDPKALEQYRDILRQNGARCDQISEERLKSSEERLLYGNALMQQLDAQEKRLNEAKQAKENYVREEGENARAEGVRTAEALEKAQKKHEELSERVRRLDEEVKKLPDGEAPSVFNPFSRGGNKRQKETELSHAREDLEKAGQELAKAQDDVRKAQERQKRYEEHLGELDVQIDKFQKRYDTFKQQIEQDVSPEGYERIQAKTMDMLKATGPNRIRRAADGFSPDYLLTKTPFVHGAQSFGPAIDQGNNKSIAAKVALCSRNDFPIYDALIVEDAAEQTLVDYWKDKEKGAVDPRKEDQYRRRLYDQVSQLDAYLDTMYKTLDDPEKNQQFWDLGITDPGNEPWHLHEKAARGTTILKTAAEAYKAGLEQGWHIDDLGTLANFNNIRRSGRKNTLYSSATHQEDFVEYEKPVYKDARHERWLNEMDKLWEKIEKTPVRSAEQRKELLGEIHEKIRDGYARGYVNEVDAKGFNQTYTTCRRRDLLIEQGREPAYVDTKGLTMSDKGKERLQEIEDFKKLDGMKLGSDEALGRKKEGEEPDLITEEVLNTGFVMEPEKARGARHSDWEMDKTFDDFNAKRSAVFMGRESAVHENLRTAAEKMRDLKAKVGYPMDPKMLPEYLNALDEVVYRSGQYQKERADANTPAGKQRLEGAKEFERMAKEELLRVKNAMNKELGTDYDLGKLRTMVAQAEAVKAEKKLGELLKDGKTLSDKEKAMEHAATILAATISSSAMEASRNGFQTMGMNSVKKSILANKEFKSVCQDYLKKSGMTAEKMAGELKSGKVVQKMTKLRKQLDIDDKALQKLTEEPKKEVKKEVPKKEEPKKQAPGKGGLHV